MTRFTLLALFVVSILSSSCKKEEEFRISKTILNSGSWIGNFTETRFNTGNTADTTFTDIRNVHIKFFSDNTYMTYGTNPENGELITLESGYYTLNDRQIQASPLQEILDPEIITFLQSNGIAIPTSFTISQIDNRRMTLEMRISGSAAGQTFQITSISILSRQLEFFP
jgi:hypothetical protein